MKPAEQSSADGTPRRARISTIRHFATRRLLPFAALVLVLGGLLLAGRAFPEEPDAPGETARPLPVSVTRPEPVEGYRRVREFTGEIRARRRVDLGFEVPGRVLAVLADEGQRIEKDAPLARVDVRRLQTDRLRLLAARKEAEAALAEMRAGPRAEVVRAARAVVSDLEAQGELLDRKAERRQRLLQQKTISDEEFDEIRTAQISLQAKLLGARVRLEELENGTRKETINAQVARIEGLDAQVARLDLDLEDGVLSAPFAARVLKRHAHEGAVVAAGQPVLTLVEDGVLEAWVGVPPGVALDLDPVLTHVVRVGRHAFDATVAAKLPDTDAVTRTQTVVLRLPAEASTGAVPGQVARLELQEQVRAEGFWVPASSLTRGVRGLWAVYALVDGEDGVPRVVRHAVEVLHAESARALVRGTLDADTRIVVGNAEKLAPGQAVQPRGPDA